MSVGGAGTILALDVGEVRIGLALASTSARLARPYTTILNNAEAFNHLAALCDQEHVVQLVLGRPRNMRGEPTAQTAAAEAFGDALTRAIPLPIAWQDETLTSVRAHDELAARGKPYQKDDVDALAATYILEDYLHGQV